MFVAILEKKTHGKTEKFTAKLRIASETRGTDAEKWRWSDFEGTSGKYKTTNRTFKSQDSACKAILKEYPRAVLGLE